MTPQDQFVAAVNVHLKPLAQRLTLQFTWFDDRLFIMFAADITVHFYFFEPFSSGGYDVVVGIAPEHELRWNPPGERGLGWFAQYLGVAGMPRERIDSAADISCRVQVLSKLTEDVLNRIFDGGREFWPPFYEYVRKEIEKIPEPEWMQKYKRGQL